MELPPTFLQQHEHDGARSPSTRRSRDRKIRRHKKLGIFTWKTKYDGVDTCPATSNQKSMVRKSPTDSFCYSTNMSGREIRPLGISRSSSGKKRKHERVAQNAFVVVAPGPNLPRTKPTTTTRSRNKHGDRRELPRHRRQLSECFKCFLSIDSRLFGLVLIST